MLVIYLSCWFVMASTLGVQVPATGLNSLLNKHIKVAAEPWSPFIIFYCDEKEIKETDECPNKGNLTYGGALWELLKLVKQARNVTFSILRPPNKSGEKWGYCHGINNCTGMIGMVNREEVDFALGPFTPTLNRAQVVEFTTPIGVMAYYTIIVPLRFQDNLLSITDPLSLKVWICFLICIPAYIVAIIIMNFLHSGSTKWEAAVSSVIRGVLSERKSTNVKPPKHMYQKLLVLVWSWMMVVLISAYKGNLLAMVTKPGVNTPFTNAEGMVEQTQIKWGFVHRNLFSEYAKSKAPGTTLRKIYDEGDHIFYINALSQLGNNAAIIDISTANSLIANDFSKTGACNYYLTQDKILATDSALAFQKQSPFLEDMNSFIHLAKQMGLIYRSYYHHLPNATKCKTINDVYKSQTEKNHIVIVEVNDIYGMLVLLGLGVGGALVIFIVEMIMFVRGNLKMMKRRDRGRRAWQ